MTRTNIVRLLLPAILLGLTGTGCGGGAADGGGGDDDGNVGFGGAQDIGQFRQILEDGGIPGAGTLDANGFFNEHYIELPDADCGQVLCGHAMLSVGQDWMTREYQAALQISMNSPIDPADLERLPLNMVVVVDTSGSMSADNRLEFVKQGLHLLVDNLAPGDRLALVEYNSYVRVLSGLEADVDADFLHGAISELVPGGATNFHDGLETGLQLVAGNYDSGRQNRVVLLSDGQPTTGVTDDFSIIEMANSYIVDGIGLTTVGVGSSFNVNLMRGLAERGAGNFYFLDNAGSIDEVFTQELDYFVTPLALDVNIEVEPGPSYTLGDVVGTKLWKTEGNVGRVFLPAVFLASRTSAVPDPEGRRGGGSAIIIRMQPTSAGGSLDFSELASVKVSYRMPNSSERIEQIIDVINPTDPALTPEEAWFSHQAMAKNYAVYNVFLALRAASINAAGNYSCAYGILEDLRTNAETWNARYEDPDIVDDLELVALFAQNLRSRGASAPAGDPLGGCEAGYDDPYYGDDGYYEDDYQYACSAGGGSGPMGGAVLIILAAAFATTRRRR